jgi:hypothetical protein
MGLVPCGLGMTAGVKTRRAGGAASAPRPGSAAGTALFHFGQHLSEKYMEISRLFMWYFNTAPPCLLSSLLFHPY